MDFLDLQNFLDRKVEQYNRPDFIEKDPISIPHKFNKKQDIEIAGFFAAVLAWGQRKTIINKCNELMLRMDNTPHDFMLNHSDQDLKALLGFKHRTFNDTDLLYFVEFFKNHYKNHKSFETAFVPNGNIYNTSFLESEFSSSNSLISSDTCYSSQLNFSIEQSLNHFRQYFFSLEDYPNRTKKHISSPSQKSACKRLNMFLRWMVRKDDKNVDFGLWSIIKPKDLICPCDLHVDRVARVLGLIVRKQKDWNTALELTQNLRSFDPSDPVKYDFALFGLGVENEL